MSNKSTLWSAATSRRFGRLRPVATMVRQTVLRLRRQAAEGQSRDRSPLSKVLTYRAPFLETEVN
jgi:hypothetical protein